jgi:hypothetical protein
MQGNCEHGYESALHSLVAEDIDAVLALFEAEVHQDEIVSTMVALQGRILELSEAKLRCLDQLNMSRDELFNTS